MLLMVKNEFTIQLNEKNSELVSHLYDNIWLLKPSYLAGLLEKPNHLDLSLREENTNIFTLKSKIEAFIKKSNIWKRKVKNDSFKMFSFTEEFLADNDLESDMIKPILINRLSILLKNFQKYFLTEVSNTKFNWMQNPSEIQKQGMKILSLKCQEQLSELSSDSRLRLEFFGKKLCALWISVKTKFPTSSDLAATALFPFVSTNL